MEQIIIKGTVDDVTFRNKENGYTVIKLKLNNETVVTLSDNLSEP